MQKLETVEQAITNKELNEVLSLALAENTRVAYDKGWKCFYDYCKRENIDPLSATSEEVADFFIKLATRPSPASGKILSMSTIILYRSAINRRYVEMGKPSPVNHHRVKAVLSGLSRICGATPRQVKAIREYHVAKILETCSDSLIGIRDAAIISLGFAAALRRSEICELNVEDIEILGPNGRGSRMFVHIRKSKTDQESKGQKVAILQGRNIKPIERLRSWLEASEINQGPLFQTMRRGSLLRGSRINHSDIPRIVKHYAKLIGLDPKNVSGHSLRAGFVTSAAVHHARIDKIMEITRHKSPATVMKYIRDAESFTDHAGKNFL